MADSTILAFTKGTWNTSEDENIPKDASRASSNWATEDGRIKLVNGQAPVGDEGSVGKVRGLHYGYKVDGTKVLYRKINTKIQYLNGSTWTDTITGLTSSADYTFSNYSSLAGAFTYVSGIDGIWKLINAVPGSSVNVTNTTKNFKGYSMIDKGRMLLWNRPEDKTGLYGSWIDKQNSTVYTTVTGEATTTLTGTLAFKSGGATRTCFGVRLTITATAEVYTDNYLGVLTGSLGGTGTINYATGVYTVSNPGVGTVNYQWEDSNDNGITDFSMSGTRVAGEGFQFPQDIGGDAILNVLIGVDSAYYSIKSNSAYRLYLGAEDTAADTTNEVFRRDLGMTSFRAAVSTSKGVVFMNTANPSRPELTILRKNEIGTDVEPYPLFPHFKFENYNYDDCAIDTYDRFIVIACRTSDSDVNDTILLADTVSETIEETKYSARCFARDTDDLFGGSAQSESVYVLYNGYDDNGFVIENYWESKAEQYEAIGYGETLKKFRRIRLKGRIDPDQELQVYVAYDGGDFNLVGTVLGSGSYVDYTNPQSVGSNIVGSTQVGGGELSLAYPYFCEIKLKTPKFRKRVVRLVASGIGYVDVDGMIDYDVLRFENRLPRRFRSKQNVSLDGESTDQ